LLILDSSEAASESSKVGEAAQAEIEERLENATKTETKIIFFTNISSVI
jgi:hypothetical protein